MKIFALGLLLICLTLTQSTPATKKIEKRNAADSSKIEDTSKHEDTSKLEKHRDLTSKIDDSKVGSPKVSLKIEPSRLESSKVGSSKLKIEKRNEDQKHDLKLEDASDQTEVDREKKSCKTLTSQPSIPAKFCMEITGSPSTVTICDDDRPTFSSGSSSDSGIRPQSQNFQHGSQSFQQIYDNPQPSIYNLPQSQTSYNQQALFDLLYQQSSSPLDIVIENRPQQTTLPSYQGYLPPVYQVSPQPSYGYSTSLTNQFTKLHPHLHHHHHPGAGSGQGSNIYLVPGTTSYQETYPVGGFQPGTPSYSINSYPATSGTITIDGLPSGGTGYTGGGYSGGGIGIGGYSGSGIGIGCYPATGQGGYQFGGSGGYQFGGAGGQYSGYQQGPQGNLPLITSCTCRQTPLSSNAGVSSPGNIIMTSNNPSYLRPGHLHPTLGNMGGLHLRGELGGFRGSANLGGQGRSSQGNSGLGVSTNSNSPGLDSPNSMSVRIGRPTGSGDSQVQRFPQTNDEPSQAMDVWGPVTIQGQRFSRGPDESTQEDRPNESQKNIQTQTSQMTSQVATPMNTSQKSSQQGHQIPEKINMDDDIVRNFQMQNPAMQQFIMERARQHLHHTNNPAVNGRYEEIERISNRLADA